MVWKSEFVCESALVLYFLCDYLVFNITEIEWKLECENVRVFVVVNSTECSAD